MAAGGLGFRISADKFVSACRRSCRSEGFRKVGSSAADQLRLSRLTKWSFAPNTQSAGLGYRRSLVIRCSG